MSYASLPLEGIDWAPFDIIATDAAYRTKKTAAPFSENIRAFVANGRAQGWEGARPLRLNGEYVRDEDEQATYLREVLDVFDAEGVDSGFVNTFARYDLPHHSDPREDFDMASFGVVKVIDGTSGSVARRYPDMPWEPKTAFDALADWYGR